MTVLPMRVGLPSLLPLFALLLLAVPAQAVCPTDAAPGLEAGDEESGVGGTGWSPRDGSPDAAASDDDESGVGGTGVLPGGDDEDSGVGGTGMAPRETRLTAVLGTITGFGSICVNGLEIKYDGETPVESNGRPAGLSDLAVGQVVAVSASRLEEGAFSAEQIGVRDALAGPITDVDPESGRLEVMGTRIQLSDETALVGGALGNWKAGDHLRVAGLPDTDGRIAASRIERVEPGAEVSATGEFQRGWFGRHQVGNVPVRLANDAREPSSSAREPMVVRGTWNSGERRIEAARIERSLPLSDRTDRFSLEGFVDRKGREIRLSGFRIDASQLDDVPRDGERARVSGERRKDGRLEARSWRPDRLQDGDRAGRRDSAGARGGRIRDRKSREDRDDEEQDREERDDDDDRREDDEDSDSDRDDKSSSDDDDDGDDDGDDDDDDDGDDDGDDDDDDDGDDDDDDDGDDDDDDGDDGDSDGDDGEEDDDDAPTALSKRGDDDGDRKQRRREKRTRQRERRAAKEGQVERGDDADGLRREERRELRREERRELRREERRERRERRDRVDRRERRERRDREDRGDRDHEDRRDDDGR